MGLRQKCYLGWCDCVGRESAVAKGSSKSPAEGGLQGQGDSCLAGHLPSLDPWDLRALSQCGSWLIQDEWSSSEWETSQERNQALVPYSQKWVPCDPLYSVIRSQSLIQSTLEGRKLHQEAGSSRTTWETVHHRENRPCIFSCKWCPQTLMPLCYHEAYKIYNCLRRSNMDICLGFIFGAFP